MNTDREARTDQAQEWEDRMDREEVREWEDHADPEDHGDRHRRHTEEAAADAALCRL